MGVEMNSPGMNVEETRQAIVESGLPVDGTVCSTHWKIRHSSPDPRLWQLRLCRLENRFTRHPCGGRPHGTARRRQRRGWTGVRNLASFSGEHTQSGTALAAELGVSIVIENVWNQFLYDHESSIKQQKRFVKYVDEFKSPWVGMQFDIGNHWKYGSMGDWIRMLGKQVIKLDVKDFSRAENKFMQIGEGDIDFLDVRKALHEINYHGWVAAEVKGGDLAELKKISGQMDRAFGL